MQSTLRPLHRLLKVMLPIKCSRSHHVAYEYWFTITPLITLLSLRNYLNFISNHHRNTIMIGFNNIALSFTFTSVFMNINYFLCNVQALPRKRYGKEEERPFPRHYHASKQQGSESLFRETRIRVRRGVGEGSRLIRAGKYHEGNQAR